MDLEKKVQLLEQEIEILKNQIQATLLDIKEQLLTNAHPSLRSQDLVPSLNLPPAPIHQIKPEVAPSESSSEASDNPSNFRKISLADLGNATAPASKKPAMKSQEKGQSQADLENWLTKLLHDVGPQRSREMIELYTETGRFSPANREFLLARLDNKNSKKNSSEANAAKKTKPVAKAEAVAPAKTQQLTIVKPSEGKTTTASNGHNNAELEKSNLVLRLIAGIQNAGVGMTWKRKNG